MTHEVNGDIIRQLRTSNGWSHVEMAKRLQVTRKLVAGYESSISLLTKEQLLDICILFGVKPKDLVLTEKQVDQRKLKAEERKIKAQQKLTNSNLRVSKKKKRKKRTPKSVPRKLILSTGFETNRRRH